MSVAYNIKHETGQREIKQLSLGTGNVKLD